MHRDGVVVDQRGDDVEVLVVIDVDQDHRVHVRSLGVVQLEGQIVAVTVAGRRYGYMYETWHFNFHQHGRLDDRYTDVFVCLAVRSRQPWREDVFVIPWTEVTGKTFSLHAGRRSYDGAYARFQDAWQLIAQLAKRGGLRRVA